MKRYLIPIIFFSTGLLLQFWLYFSWTTFGLLLTSTLLLCLLMYAISEMSTVPAQFEENVSTMVSEETAPVDPNPETQTANSELIPEIPFFSDTDPVSMAKELKNRDNRNLFSETVKEYILPKKNKKISSTLYAYYDGFGFTECFWQKDSLLIDSESNDLDWEEYEQNRILELLPSLNRSGRKLYLPLSLNQSLFGLICLETKDRFFENEINSFWESTILLSEKLLEKKEYHKALRDPKTYLFNKSHFYTTAKDRFYSHLHQNLILLKFINSSHSQEFAICLNEAVKKKGFSDIGLFQLEDHIIAGFIPNSNLEKFTTFIQSFVEELDSLDFNCELALGYSSKTEPGIRFDQWIKKAYRSLEDSILHNAA
ncbi:hypothetical protein [Leptospira ilyithenensis]|uniref:GGDEF domain-containing protein n=1 Tax=Leptospira ilyithenensis TaxID=2484901 RepID=A0A4R9LU29_9LEPT|nr:hypothetical protein [Leptospira ilyithenensis]TGN14303.1 hypothetical protein EHS11_02155 [Leptospira ilyithenensis]